MLENINGTEHISHYTYDSDHRLISFTADGTEVAYTYDAFGRLTTQTTQSGEDTLLTESYTFKGNGQNTSVQIASNRLQSHGLDVTYTYTYDGNGNILSISDGTNITSYVYDSANQLIRENNQAGGFTHVWEYDNGGNMLYREEYAYTTGDLENVTPLDVVYYSYNDNLGWGDLLTGYDGQTITYDTIGNPLSDGTWTYAWQHGRQLASMSNGTTTWNYTYNSDSGLRTQRTNGTTTYNYIYNGSTLTQMTVGNDTLYFTYDANGTPLTVTLNGEPYYYVTNIQGDVIALLNTAGNPVITYAYDAWGNPLPNNDDETLDPIATLNPLRYRGYVYDVETHLYYLQSRYYNPEMGRFLNADGYVSTGQDFVGYNMYAYCGNNPVARKDPTGKLWINIPLLIVLIRKLFQGLCPQPEPYKSADEAAQAFAEQVYSASSYIRHEYVTEIYSRTINGETTYNYKPARAGTPHGATINPKVPAGTKLVAYAHTHPNSNEFSPADKTVANSNNLNAYVVGPDLILRRYDYIFDSTTPLDPISPTPLSAIQCVFLRARFKKSWDAHFANDCKVYYCNPNMWPTQ